jgi:hypothetical protein
VCGARPFTQLGRAVLRTAGNADETRTHHDCPGLLRDDAFAQPRAIYQQTQYKGQEIGKLTGDVYYARMDDYLSVFMVTPEGIVLVEPIGTEFATWLKGELASRFKVP